MFLGDRKRKYHSNYETKAPTDADMEAYRLRQLHSDDPMAQFIKKKRAWSSDKWATMLMEDSRHNFGSLTALR